MAVTDLTPPVGTAETRRALAILVTVGGTVVLAVVLTAFSIAVAAGAY